VSDVALFDIHMINFRRGSL